MNFTLGDFADISNCIVCVIALLGIVMKVINSLLKKAKNACVNKRSK